LSGITQKQSDDLSETLSADRIEARSLIQSEISKREQQAYNKGYNDNARDCYCDSPGATEGVLAHHHLATDGESHNIRPDVQQIIKTAS